METLPNSPITDKLKDLEREPLFWFLGEQNLDNIQYYRERNVFASGSFFVETLASEPAAKFNEDSFMVLPIGEGRMLFAVLDGSSSQKEISGLTSYGVNGAFYISHMISMGFETSQEYTDLRQCSELSAKDIMIAMNKWIFEKMKKVSGVDYSDIPTVPGMAAAFLLVDQPGRKLSIAQVADAVIASVHSDGSTAVLTPNLNKKFDTETMTYAAELVGRYGSNLAHIRQIPEAKELIRRQLAGSFAKKTNKKGGCGILNGMPDLIKNNLIYSDEFEISDKLSSIYLYSDGALLPYMEKDISAETANAEFVKMFRMSSFGSVLESGAIRLNTDPEFERIPRLKNRDDSTVIEIRFGV